MKLLYQPFALIAGVVASKAAAAAVRRTWTFLTKETEMPLAMEQDRRWVDVVVAAAVKGAVFGGVKASRPSARQIDVLDLRAEVSVVARLRI